ncbi:LAMI_0F14576g1_1 [Lachancea mirantina]|uniref:LAMI_0F14576g1_1 n=1 Tax=Lachancea mirantina TaxID=1230905 RepID=A0A1G4K470_9SACH|nr:LAMI_0F14576g1_1 [Lachancea mirantina]
MSSQYNEQQIACPICNRKLPYLKINEHLDTCVGDSKSSNDQNQPTLSKVLRTKRKKADPPVSPSTPRTKSQDESKSVDLTNESPTKTPTATTDQQELRQLQKIAHLPLSEKLRPKDLREYVGQQHILSTEKGVLFKYIKQGIIPSMILWGPPGVGKTTLARLLTKAVNQEHAGSVTYTLVQTSATKATAQELRKIFDNSKKEFALTKRLTVLFIDEIHRFNKAQQDLLLPHVEAADFILIGATTENPSFQLNNALISRCQMFVLAKLKMDEMCRVLMRGIAMLNKLRTFVWKVDSPIRVTKDALEFIVDIAVGDTRRALNLLEMIEVSTRAVTKELAQDDVRQIINANATELRTYYDRQGDNHYDAISAFHKSIRGSDENAALYYLARMLQGGEDPLYIARRMIRIASEDVGVQDNSLLPLAVSAHDAVMKVGLPEADLALAQVCVALARAPKSVKLYRAWKSVNALLRENKHSFASSEIPVHLRNAPTKLMAELGYARDYKYNPDYEDGHVNQEYFPDTILEKCDASELRFMDCQHLGTKRDLHEEETGQKMGEKRQRTA